MRHGLGRSLFFLILLVFPSIASAALTDAQIDAIRTQLNASFPRVDQLGQRWQSIRLTSVALDSLEGGNAAIDLSAGAIEPALKKFVDDTAATAVQQGSVTVLLRETDVDLQQQWIQLSARMELSSDEPRLKLHARVIGGVAPALVAGNVQLFPAFTAIEIERLVPGDATQAEEADALVIPLNAVLKDVLERINGALNQQPFTIPLEFSAVAPFELPDRLTSPALSDITGNSIAAVVPALGLSAILVEPSGLKVITQLSYDDLPELPVIQAPALPEDLDATRLDAEYTELTAKFGRIRRLLGEPLSSYDVASIVLSRKLVAAAINASLRTVFVCGSYDLAGITQPYNVRIDTFPADEIDCSPTVACDLEEDRRDCRRPKQCERKHDTRDCSRWFGNNPVCEAAKGIQNGLYEAEFRACQAAPQFFFDAQCEAEKAAANALNKLKKDACEVDKSRIRLLCEGHKEAVKQVREAANVSGELRFAGRPRLCLTGIRAADDLATFTVSGSVTADAINVHGSMRYIPLNLPGHLLCPAEWTRDVAADVRVPQQTFSAPIDVRFGSSGDRTTIEYDVPAQAFDAEMQPAPFDALFGRHPELAVVCPGPVALLGAATLLNAAHLQASGNDLAPELRGRLRLETPPLHQFLSLDPKTVTIGEDAFTLIPSVGDRAISFTATAQ